MRSNSCEPAVVEELRRDAARGPRQPRLHFPGELGHRRIRRCAAAEEAASGFFCACPLAGTKESDDEGIGLRMIKGLSRAAAPRTASARPAERSCGSWAACARRRGHAAAAQHQLPHHELAVVFGRDAGHGAKAGIRVVRRARPLPHMARHLRDAGRVVRGLPLELGGQPRAGPFGVRGGFVETQLRHRRVGLHRPHAVQAEHLPVRCLGAPARRGSSGASQYAGCRQPCACTAAQPSDSHSSGRW
jgi:hypothetical protein